VLPYTTRQSGHAMHSLHAREAAGSVAIVYSIIVINIVIVVVLLPPPLMFILIVILIIIVIIIIIIIISNSSSSSNSSTTIVSICTKLRPGPARHAALRPRALSAACFRRERVSKERQLTALPMPQNRWAKNATALATMFVGQGVFNSRVKFPNIYILYFYFHKLVFNPACSVLWLRTGRLRQAHHTLSTAQVVSLSSRFSASMCKAACRCCYRPRFSRFKVRVG
jgi:hypothetical protein